MCSSYSGICSEQIKHVRTAEARPGGDNMPGQDHKLKISAVIASEHAAPKMAVKIPYKQAESLGRANAL